jgi:hypothetical protein
MRRRTWTAIGREGGDSASVDLTKTSCFEEMIMCEILRSMVEIGDADAKAVVVVPLGSSSSRHLDHTDQTHLDDTTQTHLAIHSVECLWPDGRERHVVVELAGSAGRVYVNLPARVARRLGRILIGNTVEAECESS